MNVKKILIPYDFSQACDTALDYAIAYTRNTSIQIILIHVVTTEKIESIIKKNLVPVDKNVVKAHALKFVQNRLNTELKTKEFTNYSVVLYSGDLLQGINETIIDKNIDIVFLGIHRKQGSKWILNSDALSLIDQISIPVLAVQNSQLHTGFKNIAFPVYNEENVTLKTDALHELNLGTNKNIYIIPKPYKKLHEKQKNIELNRTIRRRFSSLNMQYYEVSSASTNDDFDSELISQCSTLNIELITIINSQDNHCWYKKAHEDNLLFNNKKIPILCLPDPHKTTYYNRFTT